MALGEGSRRECVLLVELRHERRIFNDLYDFFRLAFRVLELDYEVLPARAHI